MAGPDLRVRMNGKGFRPAVGHCHCPYPRTLGFETHPPVTWGRWTKSSRVSIRITAAESDSRVGWPHPLVEESHHGGRRAADIYRLHSRSIRRSRCQVGTHCGRPTHRPWLVVPL